MKLFVIQIDRLHNNYFGVDWASHKIWIIILWILSLKITQDLFSLKPLSFAGWPFKDAYQIGRDAILAAARKAKDVESYKRILKKVNGFDYDKRSQDRGLIASAKYLLAEEYS